MLWMLVLHMAGREEILWVLPGRMDRHGRTHNREKPMAQALHWWDRGQFYLEMMSDFDQCVFWVHLETWIQSRRILLSCSDWMYINQSPWLPPPWKKCRGMGHEAWTLSCSVTQPSGDFTLLRSCRVWDLRDLCLSKVQQSPVPTRGSGWITFHRSGLFLQRQISCTHEGKILLSTVQPNMLSTFWMRATTRMLMLWGRLHIALCWVSAWIWSYIISAWVQSGANGF